MKKLQLNKRTITSLNSSSMHSIKGGGSNPQETLCSPIEVSNDPRCSGRPSFDPQCPDYSWGVECGCPSCIYDCHTGPGTH